MKKNLMALILFPSIVFSQVGINTTTPTNTLDVNGDLRVRQIDVATETPEYILAPDANGVITKTLTSSLGGGGGGADTGNIIVKNIYSGGAVGDDTKTVKIDNLMFRISGTSHVPQMALINEPATPTKRFYIGLNQQYQNNGYAYGTSVLDFNTANHATYQNIDPSATPGMSFSELNILHLTDVDKNIYYRITFLITGTSANALYTIIAERF